jgi:hypothetical protein
VTPKLEHFAVRQGNFSASQVLLSVNARLITLRHGFSAHQHTNRYNGFYKKIWVAVIDTVSRRPTLQKDEG